MAIHKTEKRGGKMRKSGEGLTAYHPRGGNFQGCRDFRWGRREKNIGEK